MSKNLTSRERINMSLNHQEADRIPVDFGGRIFEAAMELFL